MCVAVNGVDDLDFLAGQGQDNIDEFGAALRGEAALQAHLAPEREAMLQIDAAGLTQAMSSILPQVDKDALLRNDELGESVVTGIRVGLKYGSDGWADDDLAFVADWGFSLDEVNVPVLLYQGSEDKMVPYAHGQWLAKHLPQQHLRKHFFNGEGHISIFLGQLDNMLDELLQVASH
ncbi:hypothetical protein LTR85_011511 [Meristemomyces frigidus]|nr:hypothetical protein LTR85_011511 [Meristemomyces frigidus]